MNASVSHHSADDSDWRERFANQSPDRRRKILDRAARLIDDAGANPNEKKTGIRHFQAALEVDPNLALDVLASVRSGISKADIAKLKEEAEIAQANFNGLVAATQTLRASLTSIGAIKKDARLPETVEDWAAAIGNVLAKESPQFAAKEAHLAEQKATLEKRRTEALAEIKAAQSQLEGKPNLLSELSLGMFAPMKARIARATYAVSNLSFDYDQIKAPEVGELVPGEGIFTKLWTPKFSNGQSLGIECELYTSPKDLRHAPNVGGLQTYLNSVAAVAGLKNWEGHDGGDFANQDAYLAFLDQTVKAFAKRNGASANAWFRPDGIGVWALPPGEIVDGKVQNETGRGIKTYDENHYDLKDVGAFAKSFTTAGAHIARWYWSSSELRESRVWVVAFSGGGGAGNLKDRYQLSARPVRVRRVRHLTIELLVNRHPPV